MSRAKHFRMKLYYQNNISARLFHAIRQHKYRYGEMSSFGANYFRSVSLQKMACKTYAYVSTSFQPSAQTPRKKGNATYEIQYGMGAPTLVCLFA